MVIKIINGTTVELEDLRKEQNRHYYSGRVGFKWPCDNCKKGPKNNWTAEGGYVLVMMKGITPVPGFCMQCARELGLEW